MPPEDFTDDPRYAEGIVVASAEDLPEGCDEMVRALYDYWQSIRPEGRLPGRQHLDPVEIPALLANLMLIDVERSPLRFRNRLLGTRIQEYRGRDFTGRWFDEVFDNFEESDLYRIYRKIAEEGCAIWQFGRPILHENADYKAREMLCLPMARDGETVDMLMLILIRNERPVTEGFSLGADRN